MKHRNNLKRFLYLDFYYSVLRRDWRISTFLSDLVLKTVAVVIVSIDRFIKYASMISASALTFYSTLSFIPVFHDLCMIYAAKIKQNSIPVVYNNEVTKLARKKIDI